MNGKIHLNHSIFYLRFVKVDFSSDYLIFFIYRELKRNLQSYIWYLFILERISSGNILDTWIYVVKR